MAILRALGAVVGGLLLAALFVWLLDRPVPPSPPIATLPLQSGAASPARARETMLVCREIERGLYELVDLRLDLSFTPRADRKPFRWDGGFWSGPTQWTLEEQQQGLLPGSNATASLRLPK